MKALLLLLALVSTQSMASSDIETTEIQKKQTANTLVQKELIVQIERRPSRVSRMGRATREARQVRSIRKIETTKEKTIRLARCDRERRNVKISTLIKNDYLTKFVK